MCQSQVINFLISNAQYICSKNERVRININKINRIHNLESGPNECVNDDHTYHEYQLSQTYYY